MTKKTSKLNKKPTSAVMTIHGFLADINDFGLLFDYLDVAYDHVEKCEIPGHNNEVNFKLFKYQDTIDVVCDTFDRLKSQFDTVDVIGHSMGGALATMLAATRQVNKLVLLAPANKYINTKSFFSHTRYYFKSFREAYNNCVGKSSEKWKYANDCMKTYLDNNKLSINWAFTRLIPNLSLQTFGVFRQIINFCNQQLLKAQQIQIPTLLMWGELDELVPESVLNFVEPHFSNIKKVVYDDLGHTLMISNQGERVCRDIANFLLEGKPKPKRTPTLLKIVPSTKNYIWGGTRLKTEFNIASNDEKIAEAWVLSTNPDGISHLTNGKRLDKALTKKMVGKNCKKFDSIEKNSKKTVNLPVLVKFIDAKEDLSVQVHPNDEYAKIHENGVGKTEMWYVLDAQKGAGLHIGFKEEISKEQFKNSVNDGTILDLLNFFEVKKGDCFFIPAGTVHAIGKGCLICEVQQNSNLTYRIFDYNRVDSEGNSRPLHIEKAVDVADLKQYKNQDFGDFLAKCKYFSVRKNDGNVVVGQQNSFSNVVILEGEGHIASRQTKKGDSWFVSSNKQAKATGNLTFLEIFVE